MNINENEIKEIWIICLWGRLNAHSRSCANYRIHLWFLCSFAVFQMMEQCDFAYAGSFQQLIIPLMFLGFFFLFAVFHSKEWCWTCDLRFPDCLDFLLLPVLPLVGYLAVSTALKHFGSSLTAVILWWVFLAGLEMDFLGNIICWRHFRHGFPFPSSTLQRDSSL